MGDIPKSMVGNSLIAKGFPVPGRIKTSWALLFQEVAIKTVWRALRSVLYYLFSDRMHSSFHPGRNPKLFVYAFQMLFHGFLANT